MRKNLKMTVIEIEIGKNFDIEIDTEVLVIVTEFDNCLNSNMNI